jgi:hypothetical protein
MEFMIVKSGIGLDITEPSGKFLLVRRKECYSSAMGSSALDGGPCAAQHIARDAGAGDSSALIGKSPTEKMGCPKGASGHYRGLCYQTLLHSRKAKSGEGVSLAKNSPTGYRERPYMLVSKLCKACGVSKKLWHFYRVKDVAAWPAPNRSTWYPSPRCKPCSTAHRSHNRRVRKAKARGEM